MAKWMMFIYNPRAGKGQIRSKLADILNIFAKADYEIHIVPTRKQGEAIELVRNRNEGYDVVVCSGGDGTLDEVVTGMMRSEQRTPIGYIPAGSTNDYGSSLALPKDMIRAAEIIVSGKDYAVDVGRFNEDVFVYVAAFGAFTEVSYTTNQEMKNLLGHSAYILEGAKSIGKIHGIPMKVTYGENGENVIEGKFIYGMITNSKSVGGFKGITGKDVDLGDGEMEVTLLREPINIMDINALSTALQKLDFHNEMIVHFRASEVTLESEEEVPWTLDGEDGGLHRKVVITDLQQAIDIRVQPS